MSIEAMKLGLNALKQIDDAMPFPVAKHAMMQLRQAIEQAEQKPVACMIVTMGEVTNMYPLVEMPDGKHYLYTSPPPRQTLTDEEILAVARDHYNPHQRPEISFARAIEAAHGIKGEA
jgi:hypothetical protein